MRVLVTATQYDDQRLPLLVRIRIEFPESDRRIWPELTVALRIQGEGAPQ